MPKRSTFQQLNALLDSDDELPNTYCEDPDTPAYQNDNRFNLDVKFEWLKKYHKEQNLKDVIQTHPQIIPCSKTSDKETFYNQVKNNYLVKGTLFKTDVYCLSQIANNINKNLLLWFFNFLLHRDMQADYKFLKSCLIDNDYPKFSIEPKYHTSHKERKDGFKVVIL